MEAAMARMGARGYNCHNSTKTSGVPCGVQVRGSLRGRSISEAESAVDFGHARKATTFNNPQLTTRWTNFW